MILHVMMVLVSIVWKRRAAVPAKRASCNAWRYPRGEKIRLATETSSTAQADSAESNMSFPPYKGALRSSWPAPRNLSLTARSRPSIRVFP